MAVRWATAPISEAAFVAVWRARAADASRREQAVTTANLGDLR